MIRVSVYKRQNAGDGSYTLGLRYPDPDTSKEVKRKTEIRTGPKPTKRELKRAWKRARALAEEKAKELQGGRERQAIEPLRIDKGLSDYLDWCADNGPDGQANAARGTIENRQRHLEAFVASLAGTGPAYMHCIQRNAVAAWRDQLVRGGLKGGTVNGMLASVSGWFAWAIDHGFADENPCDKVKRYKVKVERRDRLEIQTLEDLWGLLARIEDARRPDASFRLPYHARDAILFLACTGLRQGEFRGMLASDVDLDGRLVHVAEGRETSKRHRRTIPLCLQAFDAASGLLKVSSGGWLISTVEGRPLSSQLGAWLKPLNLTPHSLRCFFITALETVGAPQRVVDDLAGHSAGRIRAAYTPQQVMEASRKWIGEFQKWLGSPP